MTRTRTPWRPNDANVAAAFLRSSVRRGQHQGQTDWPAPTGDTQPLIKVGRDEMTCLACGDTFRASSFCVRCGLREGESGAMLESLPPSVPTVDYLRVGEYEEG